MKFIFRYLQKPPRQHQQTRSIFDSTNSIKWVRDRALDHAVEKERNLKPMVNLKNLLKSEPSKSLPLSLIVEHKHSLEIPTRPIDFIRKYPSVFQEFLPTGTGVNPHIKLTPQVLDLDVEEQLVYQSENHKQDVADRLLKLLMIGRINKIPLQIIDKLKWDLGLPQDYEKTIVPEFPDYFQVSSCNDLSFLELVCWSSQLALSVMEKKEMNSGIGYRKGMPISFPLEYSRGFEVDKKFKKWVDDWQKLPYVSPYENGLNIQPTSDESDKWAVGVLHEVLSLLVPKKTEKDNILLLGDYLGVRSRFKRAMLEHPGIFYVSSKLRTHTVVLREGYKRDLLIGKHIPVMGMRSKYIHLMNMVKEDNKSKRAQGANTKKEKVSTKGVGEELEDGESEDEQDENSNHIMDSEFEDESDDHDDEEDDDEDEKESAMSRGRTRTFKFEENTRPLRNEDNQSSRHSPAFSRGKEIPLRTERPPFDRRYKSKNSRHSPAFSSGKEIPLRTERPPSDRRYQSKTLDKHSSTYSRGKNSPLRNERNPSDRIYPSKAVDKRSTTYSRGEDRPLRNERNPSDRRYPSKTLEKCSPTYSRGDDRPFRNERNPSDRRYPSKTTDKHSPTFSRRKEEPDHQNVRGRPRGRSDASRTRENANSSRTPTY